MTTTPPTLNDRRRRLVLQRRPQRRAVFRLNMRMPVYIDAPVELVCELCDISFAGLGFDRELPCAPGTEVAFRLEMPTHGAVVVPTSIVLQAEVVRVEDCRTGLRFADLDRLQVGAVQELVIGQQRAILAARSGHRKPQSFRP